MAPVGQLGDADASLILGEGGVGGGGNGDRKKLGRRRGKKKPLVVLLWCTLAENLRAKTKSLGRISVGVWRQICSTTWVNIEVGERTACRH